MTNFNLLKINEILEGNFKKIAVALQVWASLVEKLSTFEGIEFDEKRLVEVFMENLEDAFEIVFSQVTSYVTYVASEYTGACDCMGEPIFEEFPSEIVRLKSPTYKLELDVALGYLCCDVEKLIDYLKFIDLYLNQIQLGEKVNLEFSVINLCKKEVEINDYSFNASSGFDGDISIIPEFEEGTYYIVEPEFKGLREDFVTPDEIIFEDSERIECYRLV